MCRMQAQAANAVISSTLAFLANLSETAAFFEIEVVAESLAILHVLMQSNQFCWHLAFVLASFALSLAFATPSRFVGWDVLLWRWRFGRRLLSFGRRCRQGHHVEDDCGIGSQGIDCCIQR